MSDDIRIATGFKHHRKTKRLRRLLGSEGVEWLIYLWAWAADARWTGDLTGLTDEDIEDEIDWPGAPGVFLPTLQELKFIDGPAGARRLHDWQDWNPYAAAKGKRIARGKAGAAGRWGKAKNEGQGDLPFPEGGGPAQGEVGGTDASSINGDASSKGSVPEALLKQCPPAPAPAPAPAPSPSKSESSARGDVPEAVERTAAALQTAGCEDVHEHDPRLHQAITDGLGAALITLAATKKGRGKGLAYLITTVKGQREDAKKNSHENNSGMPSASVCDPAAEARREYENTMIEIRHYFEMTHTIDAPERDRRILEAERKYRNAVGEAAPAPRPTVHRSETPAVNA